MFKTRKQKWYEWENIALEYYKQKWYNLILKNFTIPWWELDLILQTKDKLLFVEVKNILYIDDISDYIIPKKLKTLKKTIDTYLWKYPTDKNISLDVIFIKDNKVYEVYENIEI